MTRDAFTYICVACGTEHDFDDVVAATGPQGVGWYCRDVAACRDAVAT